MLDLPPRSERNNSCPCPNKKSTKNWQVPSTISRMLTIMCERIYVRFKLILATFHGQWTDIRCNHGFQCWYQTGDPPSFCSGNLSLFISSPAMYSIFFIWLLIVMYHLNIKVRHSYSNDFDICIQGYE